MFLAKFPKQMVQNLGIWGILAKIPPCFGATNNKGGFSLEFPVMCAKQGEKAAEGGEGVRNSTDQWCLGFFTRPCFAPFRDVFGQKAKRPKSGILGIYFYPGRGWGVR